MMMIKTSTMISILFLSILSPLSQCRLLGSTGGKVFSPSLVLHTRADSTNNNEVEVEEHGNRRCFNKVMMVEQLEYQDVETCNHSYDKVPYFREIILYNIVTTSELPPVLHHPLYPLPRGGVLRAVQEGVRAEKGPGPGGGDGGGVPDHPAEKLLGWWDCRA